MKLNSCIVLFLTLLLTAPGLALSSDSQQIWTARQATEFARQNSPDINLAMQRMLQAEALVQKADVGFYPQLEVFGSYSQTNNPMFSFGNILNQGKFSPGIDFNDPGRTDNLGIGVGLKYRVYNGGQDLAYRQAAEAGVDLSSAERDGVLLRLELEIFEAFQRIIKGGQLIRAREKSLESITSSLAIAQARYDAGDLFKHDLLNLEVEQSRAIENLLQAQHDLEMAKRVFLTLLGLPGDDVKIDAQDDETPVPPNVLDPVQRPELKSLKAAIEAAESRLAAAHGSRLPTVDGYARYSYDQGTVLDGYGDSWMAGVNVNFKVFDGHQSTADIALVEAQLGALRAKKKKLELSLGLEVNQAKLALDLARQQQKVTQKMVEQAVESESLTKARFDAGVLLVSELIDSEKRLTEARVRHVLATSAVKVAIADLRRAVGLSQYTDNLNQNNRMENQP